MKNFSKQNLEEVRDESVKKGKHQALVASLWFLISFGSIIFKLRPLFLWTSTIGMIFVAISYWNFRKAKKLNTSIKNTQEAKEEKDQKDIDSLKFFNKTKEINS